MAICIIVVAVLASGQLARADGQTIYSCEGPAPTLDGTISPGEWAEACHYLLPLQGPYINGNDEDGNTVWVPVPANYSLSKSMNLYVMRDAANVYLAYQWSHLPDNNTIAPTVKSADRYGLITAFDFDNDGKFEDSDNVVNTIDDALGLAYLGFDVRIYVELCLPFGPNCHNTVWLDIFIPKGLYIFSWNSTEGAQPIGGPTPPIPYHGPDGPDTVYSGLPGPGPLAPDGTPMSFPNGAGLTPPDNSPTVTHTYTIELAVPKILFHSPAGFGFALIQETNRNTQSKGDEHASPVWTWPSQLDTFTQDPTSLQNPDLAKLLGFLADNMNDPTGLLDPGPSGQPVGGVTAPVDKVALVLPWLGAIAIVGMPATVWMARKRKA
jgi:hypothetical protein